jgi:hypothetical protein
MNTRAGRWQSRLLLSGLRLALGSSSRALLHARRQPPGLQLEEPHWKTVSSYSSPSLFQVIIVRASKVQ